MPDAEDPSGPPLPPPPLLSLADSAVARVLARLGLADKLRLRQSCKQLANAIPQLALPRGLVGEEAGAQHGTQDTPACLELCGGGLRHLRIKHLQSDMAASLAAQYGSQLGRLSALELLAPVDVEELPALLAVCSNLQSLALLGPGSCGSMHGELMLEWQGEAMRPTGLQQLSLARNDCLMYEELESWLGIPACSSSSSSGQGKEQEQSRKPVAALQPAWPQLRCLDLSNCANNIGSEWAFLALVPALERLSLACCFKVDTKSLKALADMASRSCGGASTGGDCGNGRGDSGGDCSNRRGGGVGALRIRHLNLNYTRASDVAMGHLAAALPQLESLGLKGCNVGDDGLKHLLRLTALTALHIKHCHRVTEEGIELLAVLPGLQELSFGYTSMPEADSIAGNLATQFSGLTALDLLSSELTDAGLAALGKLRCLADLRLYQAGVTDAGLCAFAASPAGLALRSLVLYGLGGLRELACVGSFCGLQQLQLGGLCDMPDPPAALAQLSSLGALTSLTLDRIAGLHVDGLRPLLAGCRSLATLRVRGCMHVAFRDMELLAAGGGCGSPTTMWWAGKPSLDTDDEEDDWERMPV